MSSGYQQILEGLLAEIEQGEDSALNYVRSTRDFFTFDWTYEEMDQLTEEIKSDFRTAVAEIEQSWGPPDFLGTAGHGELPIPNADEQAHWFRDDRVAAVYWEHQDKELPICLVLAAFTLDELERFDVDEDF